MLTLDLPIFKHNDIISKNEALISQEHLGSLVKWTRRRSKGKAGVDKEIKLGRKRRRRTKWRRETNQEKEKEWKKG